MSLSVQMRRPSVIVNDDAGIINRGLGLLGDFESRAAFSAWVASGGQIVAGRTYWVAGLPYQGQIGATATGLTGLAPHPNFAMTPEHFGAPSSGDSTAAINAMIAYGNTSFANRSVYIPRRTYFINGALTPLGGNGWRWQGDGHDRGSQIYQLGDFDGLRIDTSTVSANDLHVSGIFWRGSQNVLHGVRAGIRFLASLSSATGAIYPYIKQNSFSGFRAGILFEDTGKRPWSGANVLSCHRYVQIMENVIYPDGFVQYGLWFPGAGPADGSQIINNTFRGNIAALGIGNGLSGFSAGDVIITGNHFNGIGDDNSRGIDIRGPADGNYDQLINIVGNQIETTNTVAGAWFTNLDRLTVIGLSHDPAKPPQFINCTDYTYNAGGALTLTGPMIAGSLAAPSLNVGGLPVAPAQVAMTPSVTFATAGDLAVTYNTRSAEYVRFGNLLFVRVALNFNLTHTTAASVFLVTLSGLPGNLDADAADRSGLAIGELSNVTWNASDKQALVRMNSANSFRVDFIRSASTAVSADVTSVTAGNNRAITFSGWVKLA